NEVHKIKTLSQKKVGIPYRPADGEAMGFLIYRMSSAKNARLEFEKGETLQLILYEMLYALARREYLENLHYLDFNACYQVHMKIFQEPSKL
ncbi:MAG: hypothetical protein QW083_03350, partial [Methanomassiliicoccales archaeon]